MVSKLKIPPTEWEKNLCQFYVRQGTAARIYRELKKLSSPKMNVPVNKFANELNRVFSKEELQMVKNT
jgi:hypothetical protein